MRRCWYLILLLCVLGACRGRVASGPAGKDASVPAAPVAEVFVPEFSSSAIPPEVEARMRGCSYPEDARIPLSELRYLRLSYVGFDGEARTGEMVCNTAIAEDLCEIFRALYEAGYPIRSIRLVDDFGGSDEASMRADNTSCFNYRTRTGQTRLSNHALGRAVDINPLENPFVGRGRVLPPEGEAFADRSADFPHKIDRDDLCYRLFREHGFSWGGNWRSVKDYQHFEKP
ncbi:MAG: M15 family metallopeptidase [Bacteroidales bacterium]|nr:M15 family metallopeptidase [Bacteroidales bacterium]